MYLNEVTILDSENIYLKKSGVTLFFRESLEIRGYSGKMLKKMKF